MVWLGAGGVGAISKSIATHLDRTISATVLPVERTGASG
jgi:hypothetical protein